MDERKLQLKQAKKACKKAKRKHFGLWKTLGIVYQNIVFAIAVKVLSLILVALGMAGMWLAIFADVGVMVIAVLNAIRALFVKNL